MVGIGGASSSGDWTGRRAERRAIELGVGDNGGPHRSKGESQADWLGSVPAWCGVGETVPTICEVTGSRFNGWQALYDRDRTVHGASSLDPTIFSLTGDVVISIARTLLWIHVEEIYFIQNNIGFFFAIGRGPVACSTVYAGKLRLIFCPQKIGITDLVDCSIYLCNSFKLRLLYWKIILLDKLSCSPIRATSTVGALSPLLPVANCILCRVANHELFDQLSLLYQSMVPTLKT